MRVLVLSVVLVLAILPKAAFSEEWVSLRPLDESRCVPDILVDSETIAILADGIRRAKVKMDFQRCGFGTSRRMLTFILSFDLYDCSHLKTSREGAAEWIYSDGLVRGSLSDKPMSKSEFDARKFTWRPRVNPAADPAFDFVCDYPIRGDSSTAR